ncbi:MAG: hypothetical protein H7321_05255 [Bacteroidia bacterium]|nr:hypothetical protein [Bacteroidia bacterium]
MKVHFFVEGDADKSFMMALFPQLPPESIDILNGKDFNDKNILRIKEMFVLGKKVCLFIDADKDYDSRLEYYTDKKAEIGDYNLFLMPDNSNNGNLESIYEAIAKNTSFWTCFETYNNCIESLNYKRTLPKSKVYAYIEALRDNENSKDLFNKTNFPKLINQHFDLNHEYLKPLKDFVNSHISQ